MSKMICRAKADGTCLGREDFVHCNPHYFCESCNGDPILRNESPECSKTSCIPYEPPQKLWVCHLSSTCCHKRFYCNMAEPRTNHIVGDYRCPFSTGAYVHDIPYKEAPKMSPEYELLKNVSIRALDEAGACERELHRFAFLMSKGEIYYMELREDLAIKYASQCEGGIRFLLDNGFIKEKVEKTYRMGQHFMDKKTGFKYVLASVGGDGEGSRRGNMNMINISRGSRLGEPVMIENYEKVKKSEFSPLWCDLELIEK